MSNMLDISVLSASKYLTSPERIQKFLNEYVIIEAKTDGVKCSLFCINNTGDYKKDLVIAYKNEIIYFDEFEFAIKSAIKSQSIGNSQFQILFDHLSKIETTRLPKNYEFFIEFAMKKPTLSSNYYKHGFVLIAYSPAKIKIKNGRILSSPKGFLTDNREHLADILRINTPAKYFEGYLSDIESGKIYDIFKPYYQKYKNSLPNIENSELYIQKISEMFLEIDSVFGNKEEGIILKYPNLNLILKIQQKYQTDQIERAKIKNKFRGTETEESEYWQKVRLAALTYVSRTNLDQSLEKAIAEASKDFRNFKLDFGHPKKNAFQIIEDIWGNIKMIITKRIKGNNNALFFGKFRILSNAHYKIIKDAISNYDDIVVCLVSGKDTKDIEDLRIKMLNKCFPDLSIIQHSTGNIFSILNKSPININVILAGTDRFQEYTRQIKNNPDIKVVEIPRNQAMISATKIITNLDNQSYFEMNTPSEIHDMYDEIKLRFKELNINESKLFET